jgi:ubiquinone biosynthesis protein
MVVVEGVARALDPELDMWATAEPVVSEWIERNLGPAGRLEDAAASGIAFGRFLWHIPALIERAAKLAKESDVTRDGVVLAAETVAAIGAEKARRDRWIAAALWAIAGLLAWIVFRL